MSLNDYEILRVIGRGTYGEVHLVVYKKDKKQYVIKKMALLKASAKERKAAEQEAKLLSDLRHPNIVSYKDSFESESGHLYIVMGFAEGGDLYTKLREHRDKKDYLTEQQTVRWYIQICMALQYLHERRILHRDLKTQNIFLTKSQMIKVGDLGIARVLDSATDMATTLIGTPYYMSPELFSNRPYNQKSDVWALGCCMYEMVTLKHAFNAKDINSLMYKILKGRMPTMPSEYSSPLCDLIKDMLHQNPDKRPSVNRILRNPFIKKHIKMFLDESSSRRRRPASERSSRKSSVASSGASSRPTSARKASTNSQASSPSPHPPSLAPESSRASRINRARSPNLKSPKERNSPVERRHTPENQNSSPNLIMENKEEHSNKNLAQPMVNISKDHKTVVTSNINANAVSSQNQPKPYTPSPRVFSNVANSNANNSHQNAKQNDSGVILNYIEAPQYEKVEIHKDNKEESKPHVTNSKQKESEARVNSASSTCSSSSRTSASSVSSRGQRPLPDCPVLKHSSTPKIKEKESSEDKMQYSGESIVSVASSVTSNATNEDGTPRISSARQRRRERHRKEKPKTPAPEEIRKSLNSGLKLGMKNKSNKKTKPVKAVAAPVGTKQKVDSDEPDGASGDCASSKSRSRENSGQSLGVVNQQPESEEFLTLLHTTLNLGSERETSNGSEDVFEGGSPISVDEEQRELSPVPELSESSSSSTITNKSHPYSQNTPAATPISVPAPGPRKLYSDARQGISKGTLRSTQRLMDRIVSLRKDCIQSLGVPLLHQAYEVLDANENDDMLQEELIKLLGPVRFEQWAGKIWQLKYCEESMFGHCGTITAF